METVAASRACLKRKILRYRQSRAEKEENLVSHKSPIVPFVVITLLAFCAGNAPASAQFERLSESGISVLQVEASLLNVEVNGGAGSVLTGWGEDIPKNVIVNYKRRGDVLHVWVEKRFSPFALRKEGRLFFEVPDSIDLDIRSASGTIVIRNMRSSLIKAGSSSGGISVSKIRSVVEVKSSSGGINLGMIEGDLRAESSSGRVELIDVNGTVNATASSGDLRLSAINGDIGVSSSSGRIMLSSVTGALSLHTVSGDITGDGIRVTGDSIFETSSGRIDVDLENQLNDLSFRLTSSSGRLQVGNLKGEKSLAAGEGMMRITGESSSGDQSYR